MYVQTTAKTTCVFYLFRIKRANCRKTSHPPNTQQKNLASTEHTAEKPCIYWTHCREVENHGRFWKHSKHLLSEANKWKNSHVVTDAYKKNEPELSREGFDVGELHFLFSHILLSMQYLLRSFVHICQSQGASKGEDAGDCSCAWRELVVKSTTSALPQLMFSGRHGRCEEFFQRGDNSGFYQG